MVTVGGSVRISDGQDGSTPNPEDIKSNSITSNIVAHLAKLVAFKMQPGDKNGRIFTARFKYILHAMQAGELTYDQLLAQVYVSSLNEEFRPVATHFGAMKPTSFTFDMVTKMVGEHSDMLLYAMDQESRPVAGAAPNSRNIVCQYCSKRGHTADKCHAIAKLMGKQNSDRDSMAY
ncbi:hypothetical protein GGF42_000345 [Coemansia sp. RSA 2424]|nr:hypothetical protein GGF42_000345 [Coemansia sp. RSA 2424]